MYRIYDKVFQHSIWFPDLSFIFCYTLHNFVANMTKPIYEYGLLSQTYAVGLLSATVTSPDISDIFFTLDLKLSNLFHLQTMLISNTAVL